MFKEFKEFAMRGSVMDMAIGIIIGAAFSPIIASLVSDILMPPIGLLLGGVDFSNLFVTINQGAAAGPFVTLADAQKAGAVTINYGIFVNKIISFIIVAFAIFMVVKGIISMKRQEEAEPASPTTKDCSFCFTASPVKAIRCPNCTADLTVKA